MIWLSLICMGLLLASPQTLLGQAASPLLRGTVVDPSGAAVASVPVKLLSEDGQSIEQGVTGPQGEFSLPFPAVGTYTLLVIAPGFRPSSTQFVLNGGRHAPFLSSYGSRKRIRRSL